MKYVMVNAAACVLLACNTTQPEQTNLAQQLAAGKWIDLGYDLSDQTLYWPNNPTGFKLDTTAAGITPAGFYYSTYAFSAPEHGGTHLDAPSHFAENGVGVDKLTLEQLTGEAVVIDVSAKAQQNRDYLVTTNDIGEWENTNGKIEAGMMVFFKTGYGKFYPDAEKYFGTAERGAAAIPKLHFPGIDSAAAQWLADHKIKAVGIDTPSIDVGQSKNFKTHQVLMGAGIPGFENVANIDALPARGAYIVALPMKIKNGSGGPLRLIAWVAKG
ncbi:cyclase family protein [Panacibacter sp. DH6]|uniref:Cyclase family protein n=1 Tax=Panacibacter microcysteis TaxID=2793269 RepID=A0A931GZT9_9BACT|nr:cyclase family protein [Panacibacter microcysteis]MBG9378379.1 cyclase family protein [Panacibacter microcysteis]